VSGKMSIAGHRGSSLVIHGRRMVAFHARRANANAAKRASRRLSPRFALRPLRAAIFCPAKGAQAGKMPGASFGNAAMTAGSRLSVCATIAGGTWVSQLESEISS
jgi:hypothetical protein